MKLVNETYSIVNRTTIVVSRPKRTFDAAGSVWNDGKVESIVKSALKNCETY
jgi:hypothetical protein